LVGKLGFNDTTYEGYVPINRGCDSTSASAAITFEVIAKSLISRGAFTQEECDKILQLYKDPSFYYVGTTLFSAWGRKPVK
jgi:hypothetical protein